MIKGCKKNMIHITDIGSPFFEEAYFIVRRGGDIEAKEEDIVKEATRIANLGSEHYRTKLSKKKRVNAVFFVYGACICSFLFGVAMLVALSLSL
ncbi:MAG: hypothetical protein IJ499_04265 [Clostridia bacterium]|nr:hypothetical protein [Clostridia bacterium]